MKTDFVEDVEAVSVDVSSCREKPTAESGESTVLRKPCKFIIMCLHPAKMTIDGKMIINEITSYK